MNKEKKYLIPNKPTSLADMVKLCALFPTIAIKIKDEFLKYKNQQDVKEFTLIISPINNGTSYCVFSNTETGYEYDSISKHKYSEFSQKLLAISNLTNKQQLKVLQLNDFSAESYYVSNFIIAINANNEKFITKAIMNSDRHVKMFLHELFKCPNISKKNRKKLLIHQESYGTIEQKFISVLKNYSSDLRNFILISPKVK